MKNLLIFILLFLTSSCSKDTPKNLDECPKPIGQLQAQVADNFTYTGRFTSFQNVEDDLILIKSESASESCFRTGSLSIYLDNNLGEQELSPFLPDGTVGPGETFFFDYEGDVILGEFYLYEGEESQIEVTSLDENNIEGTFSATYILDAGPNRFTVLPDTLRFKNISFKAELFE